MPRRKAHVPARPNLSMPEAEDVEAFEVRKDGQGNWHIAAAVVMRDADSNPLAGSNKKRAVEFQADMQISGGRVTLDLNDIASRVAEAAGLVEGDPE